ncbi:DUF4136 domain-containing protein [uncultured Bacteroides sp.]|uniref:DUF4136 domain-containing protein n=1 Tax=uncultured Bacteroides sp. TaxID=162156 RepID=UPI00262AAB58|nr:DUF4136 domain-containing protein [uncultured Bacteroides sp.]
MKKIFLLAIAAIGLFSCEKDPDWDQLDDNLVVYTDHANNVDFGEFQTYFLPDSILITGGTKQSYWKDQYAQQILKAIVTQMHNRGYIRIEDPDQIELADVGLQVSYIAKTTQVVSSIYWNGWWDYGYWGPWWGNWYYPYPVTYNYNTNALVMEMVDLTQKVDGTKSELPVIWYASSYGFQYGTGNANLQYLLEGVNQAFEQSSYIKCNE